MLYILKTVWWMNVILWDNESVGHDLWPHDKCRSQWPIFQGPVILLYILGAIWWMNVILWDTFKAQWFCFISWRLFDGWMLYFGIMKHYNMNVIFRIISQCVKNFDLKIYVGHLYFMIQWFFFHCLEDCLTDNIILWDNESMWNNFWPHNKCRSQWPILHGPVILSLYLEGMLMLQCVTKLNLLIVWPTVARFSRRARFRRATLSCDSSYVIIKYPPYLVHCMKFFDVCDTI